MEIIYQTKHLSDNPEQLAETLKTTEQEIEQILSSHPFLLAQSKDRQTDLLVLAKLCNQLASHEDAEFQIAIDPEDATASLILIAPILLLECRQLILLQKICYLTSEVLFAPEQMCVTIRFTEPNDSLFAHLQNKRFQ